jgi:hypothetical protein
LLMRATCPAHLVVLDLITPNNICWGSQPMELLVIK